MKLAYSEITALCRELALLLHAGIGLADGVFLLCEEESGKMRTLLEDLGTQMDGGATLSEAMEQTDAFPVSVTGMVHIGEQTGRMEEVLHALARFYEQREASRRQIKNAVTYPAMILLLVLVVIGILLIKVLPVFDEVYASLGSRLTGAAAGLLYAGQILERMLPVLFWLLTAAVLAALLYARCEWLREKVAAWNAIHFGDRGISRKFNNAHFAQALAMGLSSALPMEDAVEQAGKLLSDVPGAAARCGQCAEALRNEDSLALAMGSAGFLAPAQSRMLAIGLREGSGDLVMEEIARQLMEHANEALENAVAKIEPAMVLTASMLVGLILLSVMLPLMDIMSTIG